MPKRKRCGHCDELLTIPVYKKHKDLFYDRKNRQWNRKMKSSAPGLEHRLEELDYEDDMIISGLNVCYLIVMVKIYMKNCSALATGVHSLNINAC